MEVITEGVNKMNIIDSSSNLMRNRIQVSNTKKPLFFYVNLAEYWICMISAAIATVITVAEILKNNGLAVEKKITTDTIDMREDAGGRPIQKAKIEILLGKSQKFDELMAVAASEEANDYEAQS